MQEAEKSPYIIFQQKRPFALKITGLVFEPWEWKVVEQVDNKDKDVKLSKKTVRLPKQVLALNPGPDAQPELKPGVAAAKEHEANKSGNRRHKEHGLAIDLKDPVLDEIPDVIPGVLLKHRPNDRTGQRFEQGPIVEGLKEKKSLCCPD